MVPIWVKPAVWGAVLGSVLTMIIGFGWGGWMTAGTAREAAMLEAETAVTSALVPVCLAKARMDPAVEKRIGELRDITYSFAQQEFVMKTGWATMPGTEDPNRNVAEECASRLLQTAEVR